MQTRPKLLHYGLSWPIRGAFANPNCALAGRDCSIQTVCWEEKKKKAEIVHLPCELLSFIDMYLPVSCMCRKAELFSPISKAHFHGGYSVCLPAKFQLWPVQLALSVLFIWHTLSSLSCCTYVILRWAEWQLYLRVQTGGRTEKVLLCRIYGVYVEAHKCFSYVRLF